MEDAKYLKDVEDAIIECLRPFSGEKVSEELVQEMVNALYNSISKTGLKVNVAGYSEHIDVNIQHPFGANLFEANIQLGIKGTVRSLDVDNRETTKETD